jgi:hypothetical protein
MAATQDLIITRGKTFTLVIRWGTDPIIYKPITAIMQSAPARLTVPGHGMVDGWNAAITNVKGMLDINADANSVRDSDYHAVTVIDPSTIEINDINAAGFKPYISGGIIQFNTPVDLTGYKARDTIKKKVGKNMLICTVAGTSGTTIPVGAGKDGAVLTWATTALPATKQWFPGTAYSLNDVIDTTALLFLSTENGGIAIDNTKKTITLTIRAYDSDAATWNQGVHELELVKPGATIPDDVVTAIIPVSKVLIKDEVTN